MLKLRNTVVAGAVSCSLLLGGASAFAASLNDTIGLSNEVAINKLVSLGVFTSSKTFNPESELTRGEFALIISKILPLSNGTAISIKDVPTKNGANATIAKAVSHGLLKLDAKGNFAASKGVTYSELGKVLSVGLGLKSTWTNRPIDFLYYLERKGVLSIDTDLDAVVTKEEAAAAIDKYVEIKQLYTADEGVIASLTKTGIVLNNGSDYKTYAYAKNASLFVDNQGVEKENLGEGSPVHILLNAKGEIAFISGRSLELAEGTLVYADGKIKVNDKLTKNVDLNVVVAPLPNAPTAEFTFDSFGKYSVNGVTFGGQSFVNTQADEVTMLTVYIAKAENRGIKLIGDSVKVVFSDVALDDQVFTLSKDAKVSLIETVKEKSKDADGKEVETSKDVTKPSSLADLQGLQTAGNVFTGTVEVDNTGVITSISVKAAPAPAEDK
ncbi:hypothetical protein SY83_16465 [Paenibacillus swuensis]|uniref:SLH domain-containing protein n=1 Tax=Paenibacillus swuensis TaxID=1178515 RepID=A0A172TKV5_9BACL|nr:S-layer homology domain-containing protein [Paenibacillus swuensis]ANE47612.1 hypothetical protein SY83_16465 [Paenibacillus swuensis]